MNQKSKEKNDPLFGLIAALSPSEKRFFKIFSNRHVIGEENNYIRLFDAIDGMVVYDELALERKFKGEKFMERLAVAKSYLYELVLKAMNAYHTQASIDHQIMELLRNTAFLYEKNLFDQAEKIINKVRKLALDHEKLSILPEILEWQKRLIEAGFFASHKIDELEQLFNQEKEYIRILDNINEYWLLQAKLYHQHNIKGIIRQEADLGKMDDVFASSIMKTEDRALSYTARILYNKVYATYFFIIRDFESSYRYIKKIVSLYEDKPELSQQYAIDYVRSINNLLNITQALKKTEETTFYIDKLKALRQDKEWRKQQYLQIKLFEAYYYHQLSYHIENNNFDKGYQLCKEIDEDMRKMGNKVDQLGKLMLHYHLFQVCFGVKDYHKASQYLDEIIQNEKSNIRQDLLYFTRIFKVMNAFESGNHTLLAKEYRSTYRFLAKRATTNKFEQAILQYFEHIPLLVNESDLQLSFDNLSTMFKELYKDPFEKKAFAYFDFISWIDNKTKQYKTAIVV